MQRGGHGQTSARAALLGAALLFGACTAQIGQVTPTEAGPEGPPPTDGSTPIPDGLTSKAELLWKSSQSHLSQIHGLAADGTTLYVSADTGLYLYVLGSTLQTRCSAPSGGTATPIMAPATLDSSGNAYFARAAQQCLSSIDSGCNPRWNINGLYYFDCKAASDTQPALVSGGSQVVVATAADGSSDAHIWGVSASDGTEAWHETLSSHTVTRSLAAASDDTIYVGTISGGIGILYTLSPTATTPTELFKAAELHAPGLVTTSGAFVIGDWNKNLHAVSSSGTSVWKGSVGGRVVSAPVESSGVILVAGSLFGIYTHDVQGSGSLWTFKNNKVHFSGVAVDSGGTAYVGSAGDCTGGSSGGCLFAVKGGQMVWAYPTERPVEATPLVHNGVVIVGDEGGSLYGLKAQ